MRKVAFPCRKNITTRSWIYASYQTANFLLLLYQNMLFLIFLISIIVKCDILRIVITLHHANFLSQRSKSRCHPSLIRGKSLFHLVICSFRVSSCDKKNLKWIFHSIRCIMKLVVCFISPRQRIGDIKHTTRFIIHRMEWKFIWDFYIYRVNKYRGVWYSETTGVPLVMFDLLYDFELHWVLHLITITITFISQGSFCSNLANFNKTSFAAACLDPWYTTPWKPTHMKHLIPTNR